MPAKGIGKNPTKDRKPKEKKVKVQQGRGKGVKVKVYSKSSMFPKAKKAMTSNKAYPLPFAETFRQSKAKGDKTFRWKNKSYHTKTKSEMEAGAKEKEKFIRKGKSNVEAAKSKKSLREKLTGHKTQKGYEDAKANRKIQKRIDSIKKRKNQGKTFSASNLKELEAQLN